MVDLDRYYHMKVEGLSPGEEDLIAEGITWPALVALNSHLLGPTRSRIRRAVLASLEAKADERGLMPFFVGRDLQERYPADYESTAMYLAARKALGLELNADLDAITAAIGKDGLFATWTKGTGRPVDYISQLIMCLCYGQVGIDVGRPLETVIKQKLQDPQRLISRERYYKSPLLFIYFSLFLPDKGVLPQNYRLLIQRFLEQYQPQNSIEVEVIKKICRIMKISPPVFSSPATEDRTIFTYGRRPDRGFSSRLFDQILEASAKRPGVDLLE